MDNKIIRDFQACLNEAIAKGWSWGFINGIGSRYKRACREDGIWNGEDYEDREVLSYNDLLFGSYSGFLDMIEWKDTHQLVLNPLRSFGVIIEIEGSFVGLQFHKMILSILESDELRMNYVLQNMSGFITKK